MMEPDPTPDSNPVLAAMRLPQEELAAGDFEALDLS